MATGLEHGVLLFARIAAGSVFFLVIGLLAYGVGGYLFLVEAVDDKISRCSPSISLSA
jgi:membrane protein implicated in regulation of membrane protease activity